MKLLRGNMWDQFGKTDWFLITTNPVINAKGAVVMGRGIALEAAKRYPRLPYDMAERIKGAEGVTISPVWNIGFYDGQRVGYFMTKYHWKKDSDLGLIGQSVDSLADTLVTLKKAFGSAIRVDLNFPGIGNGKLSREDVLPIIERLPDNVHVWEYE